MKVAVVILNWNGKKLLQQFLPSVVNFSKEAEIYVVDNASTDDSIAYTTTTFPEIKIIQNRLNEGYAKGYNNALRKIDADIFCLLNSDVEVTKNWLHPITNSFKQNKNIAIIQPKLLDFKDKTKFEYAGAGGGFIDFYGYPYCRGRVFNAIENDENQFNDTADIFWASGACLFIRSSVFDQLGGLDEDYFAHQEEIDLCWRAQNFGYTVQYIGNSTVYHVGGATLKETSPQKTFLNFRNSLLSIVKNVPKKYFLFVLFSRLILDGIAGMKFTFELRPIHTFAILKAHCSFYANFFKFLSKRKSLQKKQHYFKHVSIVWQHFVLGRKLYKALD